MQKVAHPAVTNGLDLDYDPDDDDTFAGWDRFGRVVDQLWQNTADTVTFDRFKYGYDAAGNRLYKKNELAAALSELYHASGATSGYYDGLDRLKEFRRGTLGDSGGGTNNAIASNAAGRQIYTLGQTGNWIGFKDDATDGSSWDLDQTRTHNAVNEITGITGGSWIVPKHDAAGNMELMPKPGDEATAAEARVCVYDAWNRQVAVYKDTDEDGAQPSVSGIDGGDTLIVTYRFNGLKRRIVKLLGTNPASPDTQYDYYYNTKWQVLEERKDSDTDPYAQYVWDIR